ncbi:MAG: RagB/SusD family nutrient uptake outer membrane protein [Balneolaceae bacterium]|nr:RagB/SusD family nutrient uptake outer membrane protein [Balneolaceae bacterium]
MKKFMYINLSILLSMAVFLGCDDGLEFTPSGSVTEEIYWQRASDAETAVNAVYAQLDDLTMVLQLDGVTDIAYRAGSGPGTLHDVTAGNIVSSNAAITGIWNRYYSGLRRANDVIANIGQVEIGDPAVINRVEAEARFLRAYFYTQLSTLWGDVPMPLEPTVITDNIPKTSKDEVVSFVISELDAIINANALPVSYSGSNIGRATHGAALALKARVALRNEMWATARDAAQEVMNLGVYELYPDYQALFQREGQNSSEIIFDRQYTEGGNTYNAFAYSASSIGGNSIVEPINKFYQKFEFTGPRNPDNPYENIDPRWDHTVYYTGQPIGNSTYDSRPSSLTQDRVNSTEASTQHGYNLKKWVDFEAYSGNPSNGSTNMILIRYADVLLMYAEAKVELGEIDQSVYDALNEIRSRPTVEMPPVVGPHSQDELREIVRNERVVELGFEGLRLYDMNRWRIGEEKEGEVFGAHFVRSNGERYLQSIGFTRQFNPNRDYLWPIPNAEMNNNEAITQNNPGYN